MKDFSSLLVEMHSILGNEEVVEEIISHEPVPAEVAMGLGRGGLPVVDEVVIESLGAMDWYAIGQVASFASVPGDELNRLAQAIGESTAVFRNAWREMEERVILSPGVGRGGMVLAGRIGVDESVVRRSVYWARKMMDGAGPLTQEAVAKKYPAALYVPGDKKKTKKALDTIKAFMSPHDAETDVPAKKKVVMTTRQLEPGKEDGERKKGLKDVEKQIKKIEAAAKKLGKKPEEAFPLQWRDLARDKARYT